LLAFAPFKPLLSQVSISGQTCGIPGTSYTYTISPMSFSGTMTWTLTGGVITGSSSTSASGSPLPNINVTWSTGYATGTIHLVAPGGTANLTVTLTTALAGGTITANGSQNINNGATPATISCGVASGGYCTPTYNYQWQSSTDDVSFSAVSGATSQNLSFSSGLTQTTYYRRMVTETNTSNTAYSDVATIIVYPALSAGTISPSSATINYNTSPGALSGTTPTGGNSTYTYQWQSSPDNSTWTNVSSATSQNYTPGNLTATTYYRRQVTSNGVTASTNTSTITVYPQLVGGTTSPSSASINYNTSPGALSCTVATGGNGTYTYQWQSSPDNSTWTNVSGATSQNYTPGNLTATTYYRRVTTSNSATANSNTSTITVYPQVTTSVSPSSVSINYNTSPGLLNNTPGGGTGTYTYQWQSSPDNSTWTNVSGATSQDYTPGSLTTTTYYRVNTTSNSVTITSNVTTVTVYPQLVAGSVTPTSATINYNTSPGALTGAASTGGNGSYAYQWQSSPDNSTWTNVSGATSQNYTPGNLTATTYYRRVTTSNSATANSNTSTITVYPQITTSVSPSSTSINYNTSPGLLNNTPGGGNGTYTYQWQSSPDNSTWTNVSGATSQDYTPGNLTATIYYRVQTTSNGVTVNSSTTTVTVYPQLTAGTASGTASINYNTTPSTLTGTAATGGNGSYAYQWQSSPDNSTWTSISGATAQNYSPASLTATTYYRRQATSNGVTVNSNTVTITVYGQVTSAITVASVNINYNTSPGLITNAKSGGNGTFTYQWQSSTDNTTYTNISGATSQNYTPGNLTAQTYYRVTTTSNGVSVYSNILTIAVYPQLQAGSIAGSLTLSYGGMVTLWDNTYTGGNGTYTFQWQSSPNNTTWSNITGATDDNVTLANQFTSSYYRLNITSNGVMVTTTAVQTLLPLYGGIITSDKANVPNTTTGFTLSSQQSAANGTCSGSYVYVWQSSADEINWGNIGSASVTGISAATYYRRQAICNADTAYSNTIRVNVLPTTPTLIAPNTATAPAAGTATAIAMPTDYSGLSTTNINYIRTRDFTKPGITDTTTANSQTGIYDVHQVTQYFDGLGRPIETVAMKATPAQHDLISTNYYDQFGREVQKYLPYSDAGSSGNFRTDAPTQQPAFYNTLLSSTEAYYYQNITFEASPLNRPLKTTDAGKSWTGNNRGTSLHSRTNNLFDSVRIWAITSGFNDIPTTSTSYLPGMLVVTETSDENDTKVVEYKDLEGHVILKKSQLADAQGVGYGSWLCTYYVYDDLGNLRCVISPRAVQYLQQNSWALSGTVANELCFRYGYDKRRRMIAKKVPGAGEVDMVYDAKDRLVMAQDSTEEIQGRWMVTVYDTLNRPIKTALWNNSNNASYHQGTAYGSNNYPTLSGTYTVETEAFFDSYAWLSRSDISLSGHAYTTLFNHTTDLPVIQTTPYDLNPTAASVQIRGMATGTRVNILDPTGTTTGYLYTISWYDDHNRAIQAQASNISGGWDTITTKYDFSGKVLSTCDAHSITSSRGTIKWNQLTTAMNYDQAGRLVTTKKYLNNSTTAETIQNSSYDELGRVSSKQLGNRPVETLGYGYNIKGWLKGINSTYARTAGSTSNWFGMDISYDYGFNQNQYNGNIAGIIWKTNGDDSAKAYGFDYDNINRLLKGDFTQQIGSSYSKGNQLDFNVDSLTYDANGNILLMQQKGVVVNTSSVIDHLVYTYQQSNLWSNKLAKVADNSGVTAALGDFKDSTNTNDDYRYDGNGNLNLDNNKHIDTIAYNFLNLPQTVHLKGRGTVNYVYDAVGTKLRKIVIDSTGGPVKDTATTYIGAFIYQNDTLQYIGHEEGRIRPKLVDPAGGWVTGNIQYVYDYFIRDHLGDVRMTLTEEAQTDAYAATMENKNATVENALFDSVSSTQYAVPTGFEPTTGADTSNHFVSKLNSANKRVGPTILLKVMAGDTLTASSYAWYSGAVQAPGSQPSLLNSLATLFADGVIGSASGKFIPAQEGAISTAAGPSLTALLTAKDAAYSSAAPKAFLNWALLDDRFNYVQGGVTQIPTITAGQNKQVIVANLPTVIPKNGYLYVYVSNESPQDVFFDNLTIQHHRGPLLEESHYYPFGLVEAGISSQSAGKLENLKKYNGKELQHKEFGTGEGLEWTDYGARMYDGQIGRFFTMDRFASKYYALTPYQYAASNPVLFIDVNGDSVFVYGQNNQKLFYQNGNLWDAKGKRYKVGNDKFASRTLSALNAIAFGGTFGREALNEMSKPKSPAYNIKEAGGKDDLADKNVFTSDKHTNIASLNTAYINWDEKDVAATSDGVQEISDYQKLGHELGHLWSYNHGFKDETQWNDGSAIKDEWYAITFENNLRKEHFDPIRTHYALRSQVTSDKKFESYRVMVFGAYINRSGQFDVGWSEVNDPRQTTNQVLKH